MPASKTMAQSHILGTGQVGGRLSSGIASFPTLLQRQGRMASGDLRHTPNSVAVPVADGQPAGAVATAASLETPRLMAELVSWTNATLETRALHPLLVIGIFTVTFLAIYPFEDGNGCLSRILTDFFLLCCAYAYGLQLARKRDGTQQAGILPAANLAGSLHGRFQLTAMACVLPSRAWATDAATQGEGRDEHMLMMLFPALSLQILEYAREHGRMPLAELVAQTGANRNTLKAHLRKLVAGDHLVLAGKGRGAWYIGRPSAWPWRGMPGKRRMCAGRRPKRTSSRLLQQPVQERFCRARPKRLCKSQRVFFLAEACTSALTCPVRKCWQLSRLQAGSP